jgi:hypothetical protein
MLLIDRRVKTKLLDIVERYKKAVLSVFESTALQFIYYSGK